MSGEESAMGGAGMTETLFQIKSRFDGRVLFESRCGSLTLCVEAAVKAGVSLRGADLGGAYLRGADLGDADLRGADLRGAYLGGANLRGAYLDGENLHDANLGGANLGGYMVDGEVGLIEAGNPNGWTAFGFVDGNTCALRVIVGCRNFEIGEGRKYWSAEKHRDPENRREVLAALDYIEAVAKVRGWRWKDES